jgi:hypothetical protein
MLGLLVLHRMESLPEQGLGKRMESDPSSLFMVVASEKQQVQFVLERIPKMHKVP